MFSNKVLYLIYKIVGHILVFPTGFLSAFHISNTGNSVYYRVIAKIRLEGKKLLYGILKNDRFQYGLQGRNRRELKALYFNPQALKLSLIHI